MAAIPAVVDKLEDVAEPARQFYTPRDGKFHIDLTGAPSGFVPSSQLAEANGKVIEFRDNNIKLTNRVAELEPRVKMFEGIDPEQAREALTSAAELKKKGITKPDDLSNIINAAMKPVTDKLDALTTTHAEEKKRNEKLTIEGTLGDLFIKAGGLPEVKDFILSKVAGVFVVDNGTVKAAANQFSTDRPGHALTPEEWMAQQTKAHAFAFKPSGGGGADPGKSGSSGHRPGQQVVRNPTPQQLGDMNNVKLIREGKLRYEFD